MSKLSFNQGTPQFVPLSTYRAYPPEEMAQRAKAFYQELSRRKTIREFSSTPVSREIIEQCLLAAGTAPSGANHQPWHFAVVADPALKHKIRIEAEIEEREFYERRAPQEWKDALAPLGTDSNKPFLEDAPYLIAIFGQKSTLMDDGTAVKNYYVPESVSIATGFLIAALHHAGLATLTHTPSPMGFLNQLLGRPDNEKPYILLVVGHPATHCMVPNIRKKPLEQIASFL
ncbi:nitroreductase family protein [Undibacterium sp. LX40W]|uniref:Nitroreductase family protein n=1 Tax=Undibacterium nitidum TaxID=2762298 RepID=A0A923KSB1_9BURK|nr:MULTISPECIES: nitroreductase family protein [Undibacterium]MBC3880127.1 nitroreductase family protein [Undibacterium nitidum]MBC3891137.1 nitroreductase family protein [Undibacterium sp. LX40W]